MWIVVFVLCLGVFFYTWHIGDLVFAFSALGVALGCAYVIRNIFSDRGNSSSPTIWHRKEERQEIGSFPRVKKRQDVLIWSPCTNCGANGFVERQLPQMYQGALGVSSRKQCPDCAGRKGFWVASEE